MTATSLPPLHAPVEATKAKPPAPRPRHDFSTHLHASQGRTPPGRGTVPAQLPTLVEGELASVRELLTETVQPAAGGKVYAQSLHVVGYLSMLGVNGTNDTHRVMAPVAEAAILQLAADGAIDVRESVAGSAASGAVSGSSIVGQPFANLLPALAITSHDGAASVADVASAALAEPHRFSRRRLQIVGDTIFLRDFTLSPAQAKAVLDRIREHFSTGGEASHAVVNGTSYSLLRTNGYVG